MAESLGHTHGGGREAAAALRLREGRRRLRRFLCCFGAIRLVVSFFISLSGKLSAASRGSLAGILGGTASQAPCIVGKGCL